MPCSASDDGNSGGLPAAQPAGEESEGVPDPPPGCGGAERVATPEPGDVGLPCEPPSLGDWEELPSLNPSDNDGLPWEGEASGSESGRVGAERLIATSPGIRDLFLKSCLGGWLARSNSL